MELDDLTQEQISNLTPEQIAMLEQDPSKVDEILAGQTANDAKDKPEQAVKDSAANGAGEATGIDEPVVLNKSGKGVIPYTVHQGLRQENASLKEQLEEAQHNAAAQLASLKQQAEAAETPEELAAIQAELKAHTEVMGEDFPEMRDSFTAVNKLVSHLMTKVSTIEADNRRMKEKSARDFDSEVDRQVQEAKENTPELLHWEAHDPEAWDEAAKQDEILRANPKWNVLPYEERFAEVVRRVRFNLPDASIPPKTSAAEQTRVAAKARLSTAPARKPTTLSDIHGGANPASEQEQLANLSPLELTQRLMKMPAQQAAALRAELD